MSFSQWLPPVRHQSANRVNKPPGKSFHRFPLNKPELLHKWVRAIPRDDWTPNKYSYLCSDHFHPSCYLDTPGRVGHFLHPNSIPTTLSKIGRLLPTRLQEKEVSKKVLWLDRGVTPEKNLDLKIQYAVFKQLGPSVFTDSLSHYFDHTLGAECDHLSSLLKLVTQKYLTLRLKTYGKRFTEMIAHKNDPSIRHHLTKTILFRNQ